MTNVSQSQISKSRGRIVNLLTTNAQITNPRGIAGAGDGNSTY